MAKIDDRLDALQQGFQNSQITCGNAWVEDSQMESLQVRRKAGTAGATHHKLYYISIGETGQAATAIFWAQTFGDALVKIEKWRGTYVKGTKGPRKQASTAPTE